MTILTVGIYMGSGGMFINRSNTDCTLLLRTAFSESMAAYQIQDALFTASCPQFEVTYIAKQNQCLPHAS